MVTNTFVTGASCRDTIRRPVTILPSPVAAFASNINTYNCAPFTLSASTNNSYSGIEWYVISNSGAILFSTSGVGLNYSPLNAGSYKLKMLVYNSQGCKDSLETPFTVYPSPGVSFSVPDTVYCGPSASVTFTNTSPPPTTGTIGYSWYVNGVFESPNAGTFTHTFTLTPGANSPQTFRVRLVATASMTGCAPFFEKTITILPLGQVNQVSNQLFCTGATVPPLSFTSQNTGGVTLYTWPNPNPNIGLPNNSGIAPVSTVPSFIATNNGFAPIIATMTIRPEFSFGGKSCPGNPMSYSITVNPTEIGRAHV